MVDRGVVVAALDEVARGRQAVALTFDDGYENFAESALPVLLEFRLPATVFVVSRRCGGWSDWAAASGIPQLRLMDWSALRSLPPELISLGSHSASHPDLTRTDPQRLEEELRTSRTDIEQHSARAVASFAYPYGRWNGTVRAAAGREYRIAVGTRLAYLDGESDALDLPRIDTYYLRRPQVFDRVTAGDGGRYVVVRRFLREIRSSVSSS
jgi:peptidoglycan/xylan/chitin deacetylase (PgdA/CDA1 family)